MHTANVWNIFHMDPGTNQIPATAILFAYGIAKLQFSPDAFYHVFSNYSLFPKTRVSKNNCVELVRSGIIAEEII